jgi:hypothetical protein
MIFFVPNMSKFLVRCSGFNFTSGFDLSEAFRKGRIFLEEKSPYKKLKFKKREVLSLVPSYAICFSKLWRPEKPQLR